MVLAKSGVQAEIGAIDCSIAEQVAWQSRPSVVAQTKLSSSLKGVKSSHAVLSSQQPTLSHWFGHGDKINCSTAAMKSNDPLEDGLFMVTPVKEWAFQALEMSLRNSNQNNLLKDYSMDADMNAAMTASAKEYREDEESAIATAVAASMHDGNMDEDLDENEHGFLNPEIVAKHCGSGKKKNIKAPKTAGNINATYIEISDDESDDIATEASKITWACIACTFVNEKPLALACELCGTERVRSNRRDKEVGINFHHPNRSDVTIKHLSACSDATDNLGNERIKSESENDDRNSFKLPTTKKRRRSGNEDTTHAQCSVHTNSNRDVKKEESVGLISDVELRQARLRRFEQ